MSELQPIPISEACSGRVFQPLWPAAAALAADAEPVVEESEDLFAIGYRQGQAEAEQALAAERARMATLLAACDALRPEPSEGLAMLIAETVERLVRCTVGEAPVDTKLLLERARRAAALVADADGSRTLHLHPDDLALVDCSRLPIQAVGDAGLSRGCVRIEDSSGWVEDGIAAHLDALREQLGLGGEGE